MNPMSRLRALSCSVILVVIGLEGQHEVSRTVGDVSIGGSSFPAGVLLWPNKVSRVGPALTAWADASCAGIPLRSWLGTYLGFGLLVLGGAALLLVGLSKRWNLRVVPYAIVVAALGAVQLLVAAVAVVRLPSGSASAPCAGGDQSGWLATALLAISFLMAAVVVTDRGTRRLGAGHQRRRQGRSAADVQGTRPPALPGGHRRAPRRAVPPAGRAGARAGDRRRAVLGDRRRPRHRCSPVCSASSPSPCWPCRSATWPACRSPRSPSTRPAVRRRRRR